MPFWWNKDDISKERVATFGNMLRLAKYSLSPPTLSSRGWFRSELETHAQQQDLTGVRRACDVMQVRHPALSVRCVLQSFRSTNNISVRGTAELIRRSKSRTSFTLGNTEKFENTNYVCLYKFWDLVIFRVYGPNFCIGGARWVALIRLYFSNNIW